MSALFPSSVQSRAAALGWRPALVLLALVAAQLACGSGGAASSPDPQVEAADGQISVTARLGGFDLSANTAPAGAVTFTVENADLLSLPHDFALTGEGIDEQTVRLASGETATLTLDLPAGSYTYFCTVEGHRESGMTGTFTVK